MALVTGNTYVMKPSEQDPLSTMFLCKLAMDAGVPDGVLNIIHGTKPCVDFICRNKDIQAISFVGSNRVGEYIYEEGSKHGKRVQSNMGAKNHGVVLPDANKETTLNQLVGAAFGAAGQRCMALSTAVFVGDAQEWIPDLIDRTKKLQVSRDAWPSQQQCLWETLRSGSQTSSIEPRNCKSAEVTSLEQTLDQLYRRRPRPELNLLSRLELMRGLSASLMEEESKWMVILTAILSDQLSCRK